MSNWLKNLPPEDYIFLLGGALLLVLIIIILVKVLRISKEIAGRSLKMTEEILNENDQILTNIKIVNRSYIDNEVSEVGMIYQKKKVIISDEVVKVSARDKHEILISHEHIRELLGVNNFKIKFLKFYYENSIGSIIKASGKLTRKEIKRQLKLEKKQYKKEQKTERYETGTYNARDRFAIFIGNICSPIKKAKHKSDIKRNKKIADKRAQKEIEAEREKLIEAQKLIYEQQVREQKKAELREEYQIDELRANLDKMEQEENNKSDLMPVEEIIGMDTTKKSKRNRKKEKELKEEIEKEDTILIEDEDVLDENNEEIFDDSESDSEKVIEDLDEDEDLEE